MKDETKTVGIRGHTLLCLQGFRGKGYSPAFVENMSGVHAMLAADPDTEIRVGDQPDDICSSCPHCENSGCALKGPGSETEIKRQDRVVLQLLSLSAGETVTWKEVLKRISRVVRGEMLRDICGGCAWLSLGYCAQGIDTLRRSEPVLKTDQEILH